MPLLKIDGLEIEVKNGTTVLEAALKNGIDIPYYCYHPALEIVGSCRMVIQVYLQVRMLLRLPFLQFRVTTGGKPQQSAQNHPALNYLQRLYQPGS